MKKARDCSVTTKARKTKDLLNALPTLFWSVIAFTVIGYFCYEYIPLKLIYIFLLVSLPFLCLPRFVLSYLQISKQSRIYQRLGLKFIRKLTQDGEWIVSIVQKKYPGFKNFDSTASVPSIVSKSYMYERVHLVMFVFFLLTTIYALANHLIAWAISLTVANIVFNIYPILLQQYNRLRLDIISKRSKSLQYH